MELNKNMVVEQVTENDFINNLANISDSSPANFDLLVEESKNRIDTIEEEIISFIKENNDFENYDEVKRDELFDTAINKWNDLKDAIKTAKCSYKTTR